MELFGVTGADPTQRRRQSCQLLAKVLGGGFSDSRCRSLQLRILESLAVYLPTIPLIDVLLIVRARAVVPGM